MKISLNISISPDGVLDKIIKKPKRIDLVLKLYNMILLQV